MKLHIYVFRHGQTYFNRDKKFTGHVDSKLTHLGKQQAMKIAKKLKNKKFQVAYYTKLSRSKDTLKPVLKYHPECKKMILDNRMIERSYGKLQRKSHESFIEEVGKRDIKILKERGDALENLDPKLKAKLEKLLGESEYKTIHRGYNIRPPGGESFADVEKRVKSFIIDLKKYMRRNKVSVAISAHGNSIRLFRKIMEGLSREKTQKINIPYDDYYEYVINT